MNRRGLLGSLAAFTAACTLDPELALWVPGQRSFFIPDGIVSADTYYDQPWTNAEMVASQLEHVGPQLEHLYMMSSLLWKKIAVHDGVFRTGIERPSRIPLTVKPGMPSDRVDFVNRSSGHTVGRIINLAHA